MRSFSNESLSPPQASICGRPLNIMTPFLNRDGFDSGPMNTVVLEHLSFTRKGKAISARIVDVVAFKEVLLRAFANLNAIPSDGSEAVVSHDMAFIESRLLTPAPETNADAAIPNLIALNDAVVRIIQLKGDPTTRDLITDSF